MRIDQGRRFLHLDGCIEWSKVELNSFLFRSRGTDFDWFRQRSKSVMEYLHVVHAERQTFNVHRTHCIGKKCLLVMVSLTYQCNRTLHTNAVGTYHTETQLTNVVLSRKWKDAKDQQASIQEHNR